MKTASVITRYLAVGFDWKEEEQPTSGSRLSLEKRIGDCAPIEIQSRAKNGSKC